MAKQITISGPSVTLTIVNSAAVPGYVLPDDTLGPGSQTKRRTTVESPWVPGRWLTGVVPDYQEASLTVHCRGTSGNELEGLVKGVLDALDQPTFTLAGVWQGVTFTWQCESADYSVGPSGVIRDFDLAFFEVPIVATIPRMPTLPSYSLRI